MTAGIKGSKWRVSRALGFLFVVTTLTVAMIRLPQNPAAPLPRNSKRFLAYRGLLAQAMHRLKAAHSPQGRDAARARLLILFSACHSITSGPLPGGESTRAAENRLLQRMQNRKAVSILAVLLRKRTT